MRFDEYDTTNPDFANASTNTAASVVDFNDPCLDPFSFSATSQDTPTSTDYSTGSKVEWEVTGFNILPDLCKVKYECTSVSLQGLPVDEAEPIDCADLTFDGVFNGQETDGKLTFTPTVDDY